MKPEAQRIAIAEMDGFVRNDQGNWQRGNGLVVKDPAWLPEYLNDLNAMHEVEKALSPSELIRYKLELVRFSSGENTLAIIATASQRAEAYLRTINEWGDDQ